MISNDAITMSSLEIAKLTGKQHKHVLADIDKMLKELELHSAEFSAQYKDASGKVNRCFNLTRELTDCLLTGYSAKLRMAVIKRWHELEAQNKPKTQLEVLQTVVGQMVEHERRQLALEQEQIKLAERQRITEGKIEDFANGADHYSVTAYNKVFRKYPIGNKEANEHGRILSKEARSNGIPIGKSPHPIWGEVNTYPKALLDSFYTNVTH